MKLYFLGLGWSIFVLVGNTDTSPEEDNMLNAKTDLTHDEALGALRRKLTGTGDVDMRFLVVLGDGTEEVLVGVDIDSWQIEGAFLSVTSHDAEQIHYFLASNVKRFMTYYI
jgi:hypothetical protein